jgi:DNA-binding response OmpR family regulator
MHIGLLEDNPAIQDYLQQALALNGHYVSIHTFGISLLDALFAEKLVTASRPYDMVIIDLNLSGQDVIVHIRKAIVHDMLPILIVSGAGKSQLEQVQNLFPDIAIFQKPFKFQALLQMLETIKGRE